MIKEKKLTMNARDTNELIARAVSHMERGTADLKQASEMINAAGKLIALAKQELLHHELSNTTPPTGFFGKDTSAEP